MIRRTTHLRTLFKCITLRSLIFSSSSAFSSATHLNQKTQPHRTPFKSSENSDPLFINRLCREQKFKEAVEILCQQKRLKDAIRLLENHVHSPSAAIYATILQLCIEKRALEEGKRVCIHIKGSSFVPGIFVSNKILDLYCKCESILDAQKLFDDMREKDLCSWNILISGYMKIGWVLEARKLFDEMHERDNFSWTAMISGYVKHNEPENALKLYRLMQRNENCKSNKFTVSSVLAASASLKSLRLGKEIHGQIMRSRLDSDAVIWGALLDMYFGERRWEEGFSLFSVLSSSGIRPNEFTFASVLNACTHQTAEELGKQFGMATALETFCGQAYGAEQCWQVGTFTYGAIVSLFLEPVHHRQPELLCAVLIMSNAEFVLANTAFFVIAIHWAMDLVMIRKLFFLNDSFTLPLYHYGQFTSYAIG
ncbi:unnamed protein product [Fraxinus pennsylvanica]|uniref:Pentatricopeptide repeat-containing protein n=1 Tax=Fraxinus pennsylvanica TaxID=56036 RepID=A0AAD2E890_9LAMI|nr:unnamed protein product [Fraxinus pennsylvanica]